MSVPETTLPGAQAHPVTSRWSRWRQWAIRIWYGLLSVWVLLMAHGVMDVATGRVASGEQFLSATVTAWKLLAAGAVIVICWTAGRSVVAFQALVVGMVAWSVAEWLWATPEADATPALSAISSIVLWFVPLVALRPQRRELLNVHPTWYLPLLALAASAAVPLLVYALHQAALVTDPTGSEAAREATSMGVVLAAQICFAALRPGGTRWVPRLVVAAAGCVALAAIAWPDDIASPGRAWGAALAAWSVAFAVTVETAGSRRGRKGAGVRPGARRSHAAPW
ncbi:MAG: hypothetical protein WCF04_00625 [Candidatus Nanopelagicales bacterium]